MEEDLRLKLLEEEQKNFLKEQLRIKFDKTCAKMKQNFTKLYDQMAEIEEISFGN